MSDLQMDWGSAHNLGKLAAEWLPVVKDEKIEIRYLKGAYITTGSELAMLRMFFHYNKFGENKKARAAFSKNLNSWIFTLELSYA